MILPGSLRFDDERDERMTDVLAAPDPASDVVEPKVFVRTISAPAGWPWDQRRSADLDARHGAPLPISEVLYELRRLDAWRPGAPSRFAAFYVLAREVDGRLDANAELDGRRLSVTFSTGRDQTAATGKTVLRVLAVAAVCVLVAWSVGAALARRAETTAALELVETRLASKLRRVEAAQRLQDQARLLALQPDRGAPLRDVLADLAWAANAKTPEARIEALHWEKGLLAVEARGEASPFGPMADRPIQRAERPVRRGVWLWGVTDPRSGGAVSR